MANAGWCWAMAPQARPTTNAMGPCACSWESDLDEQCCRHNLVKKQFRTGARNKRVDNATNEPIHMPIALEN